MLNFILKFMLTLVLVFVAVVLFAGGSLVKYVINTHSERLTGVKMTVAGADLAILSGQVALRNVAVYNPAGYAGKNVLTLRDVQVVLEPETLFHNKLKIDQVAVSGVRVFFEGDLAQNNVQDLLQRIEQNLQPSPAADVTQSLDGARADGYRVVIRDLSIEDNAVVFTLPGVPADAARAKLPDVQLTNLGGVEGGVNANYAVLAVLDELATGVEGAATVALFDPENFLQGLGQGIKQGIQGAVQGLFGQSKGSPGKVE